VGKAAPTLLLLAARSSKRAQHKVSSGDAFRARSGLGKRGKAGAPGEGGGVPCMAVQMAASGTPRRCRIAPAWLYGQLASVRAAVEILNFGLKL